jgi:hypothetical protein
MLHLVRLLVTIAGLTECSMYMHRLVSVFLSFTPRRDENQRSGNDTLDTRHHTNCTCIHTYQIFLYIFPNTQLQLGANGYTTVLHHHVHLYQRTQTSNKYITFTFKKVETKSFDPSYFLSSVSSKWMWSIITLHFLIFIFFSCLSSSLESMLFVVCWTL